MKENIGTRRLADEIGSTADLLALHGAIETADNADTGLRLSRAADELRTLGCREAGGAGQIQ